jgi:glycosyltransferase involved in cell wall biosynthesis
MGIAKERIEIIPNGVRIRNTVGLNVRKTDSKGKLVVFIGRLSRLKSPSLVTAIRAWKRLVPEFPDAKLVIAGPDDAPERYSLTLRELVGSLRLENSVLLAGPVTEEQKAILLATSSIGLVVSTQEAFAITCLEFMAAKKPVIASRVGGIPFVVRDGYSGILVDNDAASMESALRRLLSDTALAEKMGNNGFGLVTSSFSWESVSERLEKIYTDCVCQAHSFG